MDTRDGAMEAVLVLEDGTVFEGRPVGAAGERTGEVVFNTSLTGYQEILSDPSCRGQMVAMTAPQIGNTGVNEEDLESARPQVQALLLREMSPLASNWRARQDLGRYLREHDIVALSNIDTRGLARHLRDCGALKAVVSTEDLSTETLVAKAKAAPDISARNLVPEVSCAAPYVWRTGTPPAWRDGGAESGWHIAVYDCGVRHSLLRQLVDLGCRVTVLPWNTRAGEVLALAPDGVLLSNGPGDPLGVPQLVAAVRELLGRRPLLGIGLGHQVLGLACGARTFKLHLGHHGSNQPVLERATGRVQITAQNHSFALDAATLDEREVEVTHINLNDRTVEGMRHKRWPAWGVQYYPQTGLLFEAFTRMLEDSCQNGWICARS